MGFRHRSAPGSPSALAGGKTAGSIGLDTRLPRTT
jgi:hypothetical protein